MSNDGRLKVLTQAFARGPLRADAIQRSIIVVLGTALLASVGTEATTLARLLHPNPPSPTLRARSAAPSRDSAGAIAAAHLFGAPAAGADGAQRPLAEEHTLVLAGTIATIDPRLGYAIVGTSPAQVRCYAVGDRTADGGVLAEVYPDRVVLERSGQRLLLTLPREAVPWNTASGSILAQNRSRAPSAPPLPPPHERPGDVRATLDAESQRTAALFTEKPFFSGDRFVGVQIEPGPAGALLERMGLRPGDIVKNVDGTLVTPTRLDWLRTHIASGKTVRVAGTRPGLGSFSVTLDASQLAGMVQQ